MPAKFRLKDYQAGGLYHIYNRGIDGRLVFEDEEDYEKLESIMAQYLNWKAETVKAGFKNERPYLVKRKEEMTLTGKVKLIAYCLMPTHIHLLVWQKEPQGITQFMRRVMTNYVMYFNKKQDRHGMLWESVYRAAAVKPGKEAVWVSKFIHLNPVVRNVRRFGLVETTTGQKADEYPYSSFREYIKAGKKPWVATNMLTGWWKEMAEPEYKNLVDFTESPKVRPETIIPELLIEEKPATS